MFANSHTKCKRFTKHFYPYKNQIRKCYTHNLIQNCGTAYKIMELDQQLFKHSENLLHTHMSTEIDGNGRKDNFDLQNLKIWFI